MTDILLVDDHQVVRQGLRFLLEAEPDLRVIGEAADGLEALRLAEELQPDVLLLDLALPGLNGLEVASRVRKRCPNTKIAILSMYSNEAYVLEAFRNGAVAYVLKDSGAQDLVQAVRQAALGRRYLSPPLSERAIEFYIGQARTTTLDTFQTLTGREREVLQLAAEGNTNSQIAARLSISPRTAEAHQANLRHKLDVHSQAEIVRYAMSRGLLPPELGLGDDEADPPAEAPDPLVGIQPPQVPKLLPTHPSQRLHPQGRA